MPEIVDLVRKQNEVTRLAAALWRHRLVADPSLISLAEAYKLAGIKRPSKLLRMLRALWRVKNA
jgi:hypothetical protein